VFVDASVAQQAMALRAQYYPLRVPDALQLAAALESGATAFVTNDHRLAKIRELQVMMLDEYL
jgi:predicted nucleic acid-binding protein